jgi:hypothetical protein
MNWWRRVERIAISFLLEGVGWRNQQSNRCVKEEANAAQLQASKRTVKLSLIEAVE